ncbi:hypothetical protein EI42_05423 [Thermosporothrix hazakensis]|jgi:hypothetical protein|uniref:Uncharacterized protein n=1 Tax=Thermosporothrix hazakensis TaxID=644383 RepID=A0A326U002_THEHA|nr:hypothetical protein [Thermosporothrix hazakensis]PZW22517.1 hypothetical protein EI42_05423 [Thermosporothrix hazakensis]GCE50206.1 hypothetical protein KTH_50750 [Thermosporothrix hazakensis]
MKQQPEQTSKNPEYTIKAGDIIIFEGNELEEAREAYLRAALEEKYYAYKIHFLHGEKVVCSFLERVGYRPSDKR